MAVERDTGVDRATSSDRITELSPINLLSELGTLNRQLARPEDPTGLRFDRTAALDLVTAVIDGKNVYVPPAALKVYTAVQNGVLDAEVPYLVPEISKTMSIGLEQARRGTRIMNRLGISDSNREEASSSTPRAYIFHKFNRNSAEASQAETQTPTELTPSAALLQKLHDEIYATKPTDIADMFRREAAGSLIKNAIAEGIFDPNDARGGYVSSLLLDSDGTLAGSIFRAMEDERFSADGVYTTADIRTISSSVGGQMSEAIELLRAVGIAGNKPPEVGDSRQRYVLNYRNIVSRDSDPEKPKLTSEQLIYKIREEWEIRDVDRIAKITHLPRGQVIDIVNLLDNPSVPNRSNAEGELVARDGTLYVRRTSEDGIVELVPVKYSKKQSPQT
jgi:hypothetical protein